MPKKDLFYLFFCIWYFTNYERCGKEIDRDTHTIMWWKRASNRAEHTTHTVAATTRPFHIIFIAVCPCDIPYCRVILFSLCSRIHIANNTHFYRFAGIASSIPLHSAQSMRLMLLILLFKVSVVVVVIIIIIAVSAVIFVVVVAGAVTVRSGRIGGVCLFLCEDMLLMGNEWDTPIVMLYLVWRETLLLATAACNIFRYTVIEQQCFYRQRLYFYLLLCLVSWCCRCYKTAPLPCTIPRVSCHICRVLCMPFKIPEANKFPIIIWESSIRIGCHRFIDLKIIMF